MFSSTTSLLSEFVTNAYPLYVLPPIGKPCKKLIKDILCVILYHSSSFNFGIWNSVVTPEYTKNTKSILVKKDNNFIENLSKEMSDLIDNKELQIEMKNAGIKESKYFSKERYCKDLADFLKEVLK